MTPPSLSPLPHPSPRKNRWLAKTPWTEKELLPVLSRRVDEALRDSGRLAGRGAPAGQHVGRVENPR